MIKSVIITLLTIGLFSPAVNWKSDASTAKVSFNVKGPFGTVNGNFTGFKSDLQFDEKNLSASSFTASIEASTVSTGIGLRNKDLRNKEIWLNTDKYPRISFKSKKIERSNSGFKAVGDLTLKGITRQVDIPFTFEGNSETGFFKGQFTINRQDFKIGNDGGSVGNVVTLVLEIPVKK